MFGSDVLLAMGLSFVLTYLLGSLNFAVIVSRLLYHDDVRNYGSGNAGMTNMLRTYGKKSSLSHRPGRLLQGYRVGAHRPDHHRFPGCGTPL